MTKHINKPIMHYGNLYGILFMLINAIAMAILYASMKKLMLHMTSSQTVFLYKTLLLVIIVPWILIKNGLSAVHTNRHYMHMLRGFLSVSGSLCAMYALKYVKMIDVTALGYLEQVIVVIIAMIYYKEESSFAKWMATLLSFMGALIIIYNKDATLNVGGELNIIQILINQIKDFNRYYLFILLSVMFWALNCMAVKSLSKTEKSTTQLLLVTFWASIFSYPIGFIEWRLDEVFGGMAQVYTPQRIIQFSELNLTVNLLPWFSLVALCYFVHSISFFNAFKYADVSTVIPFEYSRLIFAGILGYIFFAELPQGDSYIGYILIMFSGIYLARAEAKKRKKKEKELQVMEAEYENS